jgi:hypothetical protein
MRIRIKGKIADNIPSKMTAEDSITGLPFWERERGGGPCTVATESRERLRRKFDAERRKGVAWIAREGIAGHVSKETRRLGESKLAELADAAPRGRRPQMNRVNKGAKQ